MKMCVLFAVHLRGTVQHPGPRDEGEEDAHQGAHRRLNDLARRTTRARVSEIWAGRLVPWALARHGAPFRAGETLRAFGLGTVFTLYAACDAIGSACDCAKLPRTWAPNLGCLGSQHRTLEQLSGRQRCCRRERFRHGLASRAHDRGPGVSEGE